MRNPPTSRLPRLTQTARFGLAAGLGGLGVLSLLSGDFALNWQPVPTGLPGRTMLAYGSGAILLFGGCAMLFRRTTGAATAILTWFAVSWLALLQAPRVAASPLSVGVWLGFGENLMLVTGGWTLWTMLTPDVGRPLIARHAPRILFALALLPIGLSHFVYVEATAAMIPAWLPSRHALAYLTGSAHVAAGVALLLGVWPRLAATLEAVMITCFVALLHLPGVAHAVGDRLQWTMLCVATALASCAWAVAASCAEANQARPTSPDQPRAPGHCDQSQNRQ